MEETAFTSAEKKLAHTKTDVMDLIRERWSPRSFQDKPIPDEELELIFEGASWAPSANNEQPWRYFPGHKGSPIYDAIFESLVPANQIWAKGAPVLVLAATKSHLEASGKPNAWAHHDLGLANAFLLLQARARNIFGHILGGFDKQKAIELLNIPNTLEPIAVIALGYLGNPESLEEPFRTRETTARNRKPVSEILIQ